jgi:hypothetical protein
MLLHLFPYALKRWGKEQGDGKKALFSGVGRSLISHGTSSLQFMKGFSGGRGGYLFCALHAAVFMTKKDVEY